MALLGGAFESTSQTQTTTTSQNAGQSEITGSAYSVNLTGGGKRSNTAVTLTDQGAVQAGIGAAKYGLDAALDFANVTGQRAADVNVETIKSALDFAHSAYADSIHVTRDALDQLASTQASSLASVNALATRNSATESDRISKLAGYALVAVAALVIVPRVFGK